MTQTEALKIALEALKELVEKFDSEQFTSICELDPAKDAIAAAEEALAQPEQEPVAWPHKFGCRANAFGKCNMGCTTPPQRKPLTDEEIYKLDCVYTLWDDGESCTIMGITDFARAIEAAHGIKGDA